jgi:hypothetical protein
MTMYSQSPYVLGETRVNVGSPNVIPIVTQLQHMSGASQLSVEIDAVDQFEQANSLTTTVGTCSLPMSSRGSSGCVTRSEP